MAGDREKHWEDLREQMVRRQIAARGIGNVRVLKALREVPRHHFIPEGKRNSAYGDYPLPIGEGQTISQPYIVALMTELCDIRGDERVLEVGTGSGYQTAILSCLAKEVVTIEIRENLAANAKVRFKEEGYSNIITFTGDGKKGVPEYAPYDGILVTAAPKSIPPPLLEQLAEGGVLVAPVGSSFPQRLITIRKEFGQLHETEISLVQFVPLI